MPLDEKETCDTHCLCCCSYIVYPIILIYLHYAGTDFEFVCCRDDLYRVELDNAAGDEMFYSKVRLTKLNAD